MSLRDKRLLVTGASGNLGKAVVAELRRLGAKTVIAAPRTPGKHQELAALGVEEREADFERPETLQAGFRGAERLLLVSTDSLHAPKVRIKQHRAAIQAAVGAGGLAQDSLGECGGHLVGVQGSCAFNSSGIADGTQVAHRPVLGVAGFRAPTGTQLDLARLGRPVRLLAATALYLRGTHGHAGPVHTQVERSRRDFIGSGRKVAFLIGRDVGTQSFRRPLHLLGVHRNAGQFL